MDNNDFINKLLIDIKDIDSIVDGFIAYNKIPQVEIDLLLSKIRALYDTSLQLNRVNKKLEADESIDFDFVDDEDDNFSENQNSEETDEFEVREFVEKDSFNNIVSELMEKTEIRNAEKSKVPNEEIEAEQTESYDSLKVVGMEVCAASKNSETENKTVEPQKTISEESEIVEQPKIEVPQPKVVEHSEPSQPIEDNSVVEKSQSKKIEIEHETLNDHISQESEKIIINDVLANQAKSVLVNKLNQKPIENISKAIGLNDKFLYIRELFSGSADEFNKTISVLNDLPNFDEAYKYLSKFGWDDSDVTVTKFLEIVNRRYLK